ncbi:trehalase family glycosidase [Streptomyces sp. DSM 44915]|uniref:Trehalase family glycosidase n=1 Tax=Streptomyces chisholmiae TaxID=3075540 RepID=A0ABU2JRB9_9ACTN|nr:trehalase family glycosidase [Streptomyces sp. DSM 44915]MDT0267525.1 trehalase family glycosidase [Streptomyces sp. DSM 44915]
MAEPGAAGREAARGVDVDGLLATGRRGLRTRPGRLLLGPTGARLWADVLTEDPGFVGVIDVVHKLNMPMLFTVAARRGGNDAGAAGPADVEWRPSSLRVEGRLGGGLSFRERKTISWEDVALSEQTWRNEGELPVVLRLSVDRAWCAVEDGHAHGFRPVPERGFTVSCSVAASRDELWEGLALGPGEEAVLRVAAAVEVTEGLTGPSPDVARATRRRASAGTEPGAVDRATAAYRAWFADAPGFSSSDPVLDRVWAYRWFLLRHNLAAPDVGALRGTVMYEGRSHKMTKEPWRPEGWEFSKHIPLSTPLHLLDLRWYRDGTPGAEVLASLPARQGADGQFHSATANEVMHPYANFAGWAAARYARLHGAEALRAVLPALKRQVRGERDVLSGADALPVQHDHRLTGKEYQPSYWYFAGYPDDPKDPAGYTPLKRVDRAVYQYLNARGVAELCRGLADPDAEEFEALAVRVARSVRDKQWDAEDGFFHDLDAATDRRARVRNVVGFYPLWAGLADPSQRAALVDALGDPDGFATDAPVPSVETRCPVFAQGGGWKGHFLKGRNGCMWNGPTWPYTNSVVLDAVGRAARETDHRLDSLFARLLRATVNLHFTQHDGRTPYLVEHYDSRTGEPISDEPDYNHSYLIDLVVRYVAGLTVSPDTLRLDPVDIGLTHFRLTGAPALGHRVDVAYETGTGLDLFVDGEHRAHRADLGRLETRLAGPRSA